jgi:hypothetical protein
MVERKEQTAPVENAPARAPAPGAYVYRPPTVILLGVAEEALATQLSFQVPEE